MDKKPQPSKSERRQVLSLLLHLYATEKQQPTPRKPMGKAPAPVMVMRSRA